MDPNNTAFTFSTDARGEMFHITYDGVFVFGEGIEPEEAAHAFARFFNEEMKELESDDEPWR